MERAHPQHYYKHTGLTALPMVLLQLIQLIYKYIVFLQPFQLKKNSLETLSTIYPELQHSVEYHLKLLNKIVRYLPLLNSDYSRHLPCKALVFIKYNKNLDLSIQPISKIKAFEK